MTLIRPTNASGQSNTWRYPPSERQARQEAWRRALEETTALKARQHTAETPRTPSEPLVLWPLLLEDSHDLPAPAGAEAEAAYGARLRVTFAPPPPGSGYDGWA